MPTIIFLRVCEFSFVICVISVVDADITTCVYNISVSLISLQRGLCLIMTAFIVARIVTPVELLGAFAKVRGELIR